MQDFLAVLVRIIAAAVQTNGAYRLYGVYFDRQSADKNKEWAGFLLCFLLCGLKAVLNTPPAVNGALTIGIYCGLAFLYAGTVLGRLTRALGIVALMVLCEGLVGGLMAFFPLPPRTAWVTGTMLSQLLFLMISLSLKGIHMPKTSPRLSRLYWLAILCLPTGTLAVHILLIFVFYDPAGNPIFLPVSIMLMLINLLTFYVLDRLEEYSAAYYETELLARQNQAYRAEFELMRQSQQQVSALRHDMKNHLAVVRQYAAAGQTEELGRYLDRCLEQLAQPGFVHTGNPDIDSMLNYKLAQAERAGARLTLDIRLPEDFTADAFDWNILLGSLLDHAVEALEKSREKRLSLSLRVDRGIFYLKMAYSDDGPAPESEGASGLGGSLVQRAIDKYHGTLDVDHAGQICTVKVMLYLEP